MLHKRIKTPKTLTYRTNLPCLTLILCFFGAELWSMSHKGVGETLNVTMSYLQQLTQIKQTLS